MQIGKSLFDARGVWRRIHYELSNCILTCCVELFLFLRIRMYSPCARVYFAACDVDIIAMDYAKHVYLRITCTCDVIKG